MENKNINNTKEKNKDITIAYVRISQKEENIDNQKKAIAEFLHKDINEIKFFEDIKSGSVKAEEREGFSNMLKYIEANKPDIIYVYEISRLGRSMLETLNIIMQLENKGVIVYPISPKEKWLATVDKSIRNLIMAIFSWVAERERELLIERTKNALEHKKMELEVNGYFISSKTGKKIYKLGRPKRNIDWKSVENYREKGLSYADIARLLEIPYPTLMSQKRLKRNN